MVEAYSILNSLQHYQKPPSLAYNWSNYFWNKFRMSHDHFINSESDNNLYILFIILIVQLYHPAIKVIKYKVFCSHSTTINLNLCVTYGMQWTGLVQMYHLKYSSHLYSTKFYLISLSLHVCNKNIYLYMCYTLNIICSTKTSMWTEAWQSADCNLSYMDLEPNYCLQFMSFSYHYHC